LFVFFQCQVLRELKWTKASDVYSFGPLVFEVYSGGQCPFGELGNDALLKILLTPDISLVAALFATPWPNMTPALGVFFPSLPFFFLSFFS
jgi:hypothetical protein